MKHSGHYPGILILPFVLCSLLAAGQNSGHVYFRNIVKQQLGLAQNATVREIVQDEAGFIWLATGKGLYRYDGLAFKGYYPNPDDTSSVSDIEIMSLFFSTATNRLFIGTALHGLDIYDSQSDRFDQLPDFPDSLGRIWAITGDANGTIWVGADYGLISIDEHTLTYRVFQSQISAEDPRLIVRTIVQDTKQPNILWLGTHLGLMRFNFDSRVFSQQQMPYPSQYYIADCLITTSGDLWCASYHGGLLRYNPARDVWDNYDLPEYLKARPDGRYNVVYSVAQVDSTLLWFTAFDGVGTFDITTHEFHMFEKSDENPLMLYPSDSYRSLCIVPSRFVFIGGSDILSIAHANMPSVSLLYKPVITSMFSGTTTLSTDTNALYRAHLVLSDTEHDLRVSVSVPEYTSPGHVRYRYQLEGYDPDWIDSGTGRLIRYTNLKKGRYTFRYQASLDGMAWKDGAHVVKVEKKVSFWKTPIFLILGALFLTGILLLINMLRLRRVRIEAKRQTAFDKKIAEVEMTALRAQMNPHFIFNALSSIKYFVLENEIDAANTYLTKFSQLLRAVLKNSKSKLVMLADELQALRLYIELEAVRFTEKFEYTIEADPAINQEKVVMAPLLIQPYVENAIWHGLLQKKGPGHLWVRIRALNELLQIEIEDDGIGRVKAGEFKSKMTSSGKSLGMQITKDRVDLIKQSMGIDSRVRVEDLYTNGTATGTRVVIEIPYILKNDHNDVSGNR